MAEVRWDDSLNPLWADMATTTTLDDGSVGDSSTGELAQATDESTNVCRYLQATAALTAQKRLGTIHSVTGLSWRVVLVGSLEAT